MLRTTHTLAVVSGHVGIVGATFADKVFTKVPGKAKVDRAKDQGGEKEGVQRRGVEGDQSMMGEQRADEAKGRCQDDQHHLGAQDPEKDTLGYVQALKVADQTVERDDGAHGGQA